METGKRVDSYVVVMIDRNTGETHHFAGWEQAAPHADAAKIITSLIHEAGHIDLEISTRFFTA